jgi:hypothetical protein
MDESEVGGDGMAGTAADTPGPDLGERAAALADSARDVLEVAVGLGVLGLLRLQSARPQIEAELERMGLASAATVTRQAGELLDRGMRRVMSSLVG